MHVPHLHAAQAVISPVNSGEQAVAQAPGTSGYSEGQSLSHSLPPSEPYTHLVLSKREAAKQTDRTWLAEKSGSGLSGPQRSYL